MDGAFRPRELFPRCVVVKPFKGVTLNSVGLSGPGIVALSSLWKSAPDSRPWMVSVMSVRDTPSGRSEEMCRIADVLGSSSLPSHVGVQLNLSCPNVGLDPSVLLEDARAQVDALAPLRRPLLLKVNALFPVGAAVDLSRVKACDGFIVSNTIPWGKLRDRVDWKGLFGSNISPLAGIGGGGLSGKPLLPIVTDWVRAARRGGFVKPIVGGGGILSVQDAAEMIDSGVNAIELGSVSILRPWRVSSIIDYANKVLPLRTQPLRLVGAV